MRIKQDKTKQSALGCSGVFFFAMLFTSVELVETQKKAKSKYKGKGQVNSNDCVADYVCTKE